jgi:hypothetical protein
MTYFKKGIYYLTIVARIQKMNQQRNMNYYLASFAALRALREPLHGLSYRLLCFREMKPGIKFFKVLEVTEFLP